MRTLTNREIVRVLHEMAALYAIEGVEFKPRAYERAAQNIEALEGEVAERYRSGGVKALLAIPGVGKGIAGHIEELLETGRFREYDKLKKKMPVRLDELLLVEGIGPRTVATLWQALKIKDLGGLEKAARAGKIGKLPSFGARSEQKILKGIEFLRKSSGRFVLGFLDPTIRKIEDAVRKFPEVSRAAVAGSVRRRKETVGDIDIQAAAKEPAKVAERFVALPEVEHVYAKGPGRTSVRLKLGLDADLRVVPEESWGAALCYFTGSKAHNVALRARAMAKGCKLNEYGLFKGKTSLAGKSEEEVYRALGLAYIEPELREAAGEIEAAAKGRLPRLIGYGDLQGDLQIQTDWTDGRNSLEEMAEAAEALGLEYIAITDHTRALAMTGGLTEAGIAKQGKAIDALNRKLRAAGKRVTVLKGTEVNILDDGSLDIADDALAQLDVVGAAVHTRFDLPREAQTERIVRAMENPNVDVIFHLTTRIINRRKAIDLDLERIVAAAKRTGTILEVDAFPDRLDINDGMVRACVEAGVKIAIDSDAHAAEHLRFLECGIAQARRGWAEKKDVVNALPLRQFLAALK
ncbi:MAG: DNA polymerase/3'-5' exonuclease PolX [Rhodospirillales bacterium]|nr:DNA polymerase/3'-5' exonuclease PolX [Rhodospirillales bacterium]